jgi:hypothetical protein
MSSVWFSAVTVLILTLLSFFVFPGHTILQADTQIYIPILEHIADPTLFTNDIMAVRPHVSFTLYDEAALLLRRVTGLSFEHVLMGQQFVYRGVGVLGLYLFAIAAGLNPAMSSLFAAILSLGGAIIGPAVLIVEYEPVPRGFALPFVIFSLAMVAMRRWDLAAAAATIAFAFHPPTAFAYCAVLGMVFLWQRAFRPMAVLAIGPLLLILCILVQAPSPETPPVFGTIDPALEVLQRMRATYNWVGMWADKWMPMYVLLWAVVLFAWWRIRGQFNRETNLFLVVMPLIGMISIPVSYVLLERMKWVLIPQFQPGRYLLFVTLFAMMLAALAGIRAAERKSYIESFLFFVVPIAAASMEWDVAKLLGARLAVVCGLALLVMGAAVVRSRPWLVAVAAIAPFFALPYLGDVTNYGALHTAELDEVAEWAREHTAKDAIFQFGDAEKKLEPGVFRARGKRALYVDWKAGGQVNFLKPFSLLWAERWEVMRRRQPVEEYQRRGIDYLVLRSSHREVGMTPVFQNTQWVVYDLKKSSTSLREGIDTCAPVRVTEIAAAALAKRSASGSDCPSESAIASPALKVSPAAVVSLASTRNPGA